MVKILVVDDNHTPRELIRELLRKYNIEVEEAANGVEAQEIIKEHKFDLVITDLIMPEMNGYELCRWLRSNPKTEAIPILICSTKSEKFDQYYGLKFADAYLTKPFKGTELLKTIKYLLQAKKQEK
jgi:twitching motility two-component system response regulator PilH